MSPSLIYLPDLPIDSLLHDSVVLVLVPLGKTHVAALVPNDGVNALDTIAHGAGRVDMVLIDNMQIVLATGLERVNHHTDGELPMTSNYSGVAKGVAKFS